MAGLYPDVPGPRMAWDRDGSVLVYLDTSRGSPTLPGTGVAQQMNNEIDGGGDGGQDNDGGHNDGYFTVIFPELRDVIGYAAEWQIAAGGGQTGVWTSTDTTTGADGTWVSRGAWVNSGTTKEKMRTTIQAVSYTGVKAVSFGVNTSGGPARCPTMHLYGTINAGQNPNRLRFWHPTTDAEITGPHFDLGDQARGASVVSQFRIKNNSSTLTANSIGITREALTDTSPTNVGQVEFSVNATGPWTSSIDIGNLAPSALSGILYTRRSTSLSAALSLWWVRFIATATTWT